ncbi:pilus assembly protein [Stutzerimonas kirkiae]|uniref:Pilus assembly protein n=1 Tax=Stutzerimonas kirkiae TaxID=2211392 RepID=A0A4Q9QXG9_9GAMM|nr:pilus assembly protein [Stutzerimonas kirkiae]TBU89064.1 pilus assembly protein [Stutzerimonas kirkiae]TBU99405.1 pilus assembly protein [Stutzerimonas kirkiae]TBV03870.1 pilus assembly protein [Stutzerimonas kirkiae]TBV14874.1 pilus assembly protein [Stutzerimonas kirkiae]
MDNTFLVAVRTETQIDWLQEALAAQGQLLRAGQDLDELLGLLEVTPAQLVFVEISFEQSPAQCSLIEGLLEARPLLSVVAIGDGFDNQLVIGAMRAGARDFISYGLRGSEIAGLVRRLCQRLPALPERRGQGRISLFYGAQADADAALVASQVAHAVALCGRPTLLVDIGMPVGEGLQALGVEATFSFGDALRNIRRLDAGLIDSAFARHPGGLRLLGLAGGDEAIAQYGSAELYLLLGVLRQNFAQVIINLCGQPPSDALRTLLINAQKLYWYADQSVSGCRRNLELIRYWQERGVSLESAQLVVDRYIDSVAPDARTLLNTFELQCVHVLPLEGELRLAARNQGQPLGERAPRNALSRALGRLALGLAEGCEGCRQGATVMQRLFERIRG